jgi:hypothetical protein
MQHSRVATPHPTLATPRPLLAMQHSRVATPHSELAMRHPQWQRLTLNSYAHLTYTSNTQLSIPHTTITYASPLSKLSPRLAVPLKIGEINCVVVWNWAKKGSLFSMDST